MSLETAKRLASRILKCGETRVRVLDAKKASDALTADDVRSLINQGAIGCIAKIGVGRGKSKFKQSRKLAGRRRGTGSTKGKKFALEDRKERWMKKIRAQRKMLSHSKKSLEDGAYKKAYSMSKGGYFKDKKHLAAYLAEHKKK